MDYNDFTRVVDEKERGLEMQVAFPALMRKVYGWMALALVITGLTSYMVASSPGLMQMIFANRLVFWGMVIAEFAIVFVISGRINRLSLVSATTWFVVYSVLNGALLSFIFMVYTQTAITEVFFITAGTFGAMAYRLDNEARPDKTRRYSLHGAHRSDYCFGRELLRSEQYPRPHRKLCGSPDLRGTHGLGCPAD